nr:toxin-antitoxin system YwqK family antitoxin [Pseudopedobacter sp.]
MEVAFMVQLVRLVIRGILFLTLFSACNFIRKESSLKLNAEDKFLTAVNDLIVYQEKPFTGMIYQLYPNSKDTLFVNNYTEGKTNGVSKKFYSQHQIKEIRYYKNGLKEGEYLALWPDGKKQSAYFFKDGEYEGVFRAWNDDGQLIQEMHYEKGYEVGSQKMFYDDGKIRCNYQMINGRRYGLLGTKNCVNVSDSVFIK